MNLILILLCAFLALILLALVAIRKATDNFKRLRMGCFFDLEAREQGAGIREQGSEGSN